MLVNSTAMAQKFTPIGNTFWAGSVTLEVDLTP